MSSVHLAQIWLLISFEVSYLPYIEVKLHLFGPKIIMIYSICHMHQIFNGGLRLKPFKQMKMYTDPFCRANE